jgi:hypothetical protein
MLLIDNERVSNAAWDEEAEDALREALRDADAGLIAEAFCYAPPGREAVGPHHEVRNGVLIINRDALYRATGVMSYPREEDRNVIPQAARVDALAHLRRHLRACDDVPIGE